MLSGGKTDKFSATVERSPRKWFVRLTQPANVSAESARNSAKLLPLNPNKTTVLHKL
jgi:hypothetical protein